MEVWNPKLLGPFLALFLSIPGPMLGQTTRVEAMYVDGFSFNVPITDAGGTALTAGEAGNGNGAIVQIGYFLGVSVSLAPEDFEGQHWASFTALTGVGSPNEIRHPTSIGDMDSPATGPFGFLFIPDPVAIELDVGLDSGLPDSYPVRLGMRFFDDISLASSTGYNTVTSSSAFWLLQEPEASPASNSVLDMDADPLFWESGPSGALRTVMTFTPEPSSTLLILLGSLGLARRRRKS